MNGPKRDPKLEWNNFWNEIAESIADLSDDELLAEMREAGEDPVQVAEEVRHVLGDAVKKYRQRHLWKARDQYHIEAQSLRQRIYQLPRDLVAKRKLLGAVLARQPQFGVLTAQWRDLQSIPDTDVDGILQQLGALGVLDESSPRS